MSKKLVERTDDCHTSIQGVKDTQDLLSGKWEICIVGALYYNGKLRFMDLSRQLNSIAPKVLSKELKDLEMNQLVTRTVRDTMPITVEYELTAQGISLNKVIVAMCEWGKAYRKTVLKKHDLSCNPI